MYVQTTLSPSNSINKNGTASMFLFFNTMPIVVKNINNDKYDVIDSSDAYKSNVINNPTIPIIINFILLCNVSINLTYTSMKFIAK